MNGVSEQRRVRFACIDGIERDDLSLAGEIWRDDVVAAPWADRSAMKIAAHLAHYMGYPSTAALALKAIENQHGLNQEDVEQGLIIMRNYGAVESFSLEDGEIRAALQLSLLQRLRVLDARARFSKLLGRTPNLLTTQPTWLESHGLNGHVKHN